MKNYTVHRFRLVLFFLVTLKAGSLSCVKNVRDGYSGLSMRCKFIKTTIYSSYIITHYHDEGIGVVSLPLSENPGLTNQTLIQASSQFGLNLFFSWK